MIILLFLSFGIVVVIIEVLEDIDWEDLNDW